MAPRAPRPGTTRRARPKQNTLRFEIDLDGDHLVLDMRDVGAMDEQMFEAQVKRTISEVGSNLDSPQYLAAIVWFARRKRGEKRLNYRDVLRDFPSRMELADMFDAGTFDLDVITGDDDIDEAPADGEEVEATDPLPSAGD